MLNGAEKKSVKRDEATVVELSAPQPTKVDFSNTVERKKFIEQSLNN
jgi:hypothetical protein